MLETDAGKLFVSDKWDEAKMAKNWAKEIRTEAEKQNAEIKKASSNLLSLEAELYGRE